jgi:hypothetical protein
MDAVMLQLTRARNRLTTPATLTLPEIAASGLTVSVLCKPLLQERGFLWRPSLHPGVDTAVPNLLWVGTLGSFVRWSSWTPSCVPTKMLPLLWAGAPGEAWKPQAVEEPLRDHSLPPPTADVRPHAAL